MQRWILTSGLAVTALGAAFLVPHSQDTGPLTPAPVRQATAPNAADSQPLGAGQRLSLSAVLDQGALLAGAGEDRFLVFEVSADAPSTGVDQLVHLAVVMDTSGSMSSAGKLSNARRAAQEMVDLLGPEDTFSLVTFDDRADVVIPAQPVDDPASLQHRIDTIQSGGGTNLHDGLRAGLREAQTAHHTGVRRVVVLSDGHANIGITDSDTLYREAGSLVQEGVTVSAMGLGLDYNEDLLAAMSDVGGGTYRFVDRPAALAEQLATELQQMSAVVAHQTELRIDLAEGVMLKQIYGYEANTSGARSTVFLGDLYGGQTRKIVARVHVPDHSLGSVDVATARLHHMDAETERQHATSATVQALVTSDASVAQTSAVAAAQKMATQARVGQLVDIAARSFAEGDLSSNQASMEAAIDLVATFNADFEDSDMLKSLGDFEAQAARFAKSAPSSAAGRRAVKQAKEGARAYAR